MAASRIREHAEYEGVRVRFHATVAKARVPMQVDIGFGDVIVPEPTEVTYPTLLDLPIPVSRAYSRETVVAEKLEALTALGLLNSRLDRCAPLRPGGRRNLSVFLTCGPQVLARH